MWTLIFIILMLAVFGEMIGFAVILAAVLLSELKPGKKTPGR